MTSGHVLRFPRSDEEGAFVIVQATSTRSKALDVKLVGTDGREPYAISCELNNQYPATSLTADHYGPVRFPLAVRHDKVSSFRVKNSPCSEDEWVSILTAVLRQDPASDIEVLASVEDQSSITLTIRKKGKEFTQRLGAIELSHNPRELIELYDWCGLSVQTADEAKEALASATAKASQLEETVRELKAQLDELVAAKEADESELLEKFRDLLNEKKVKIRQQQRILASASVDPEDPAQEPNLSSSGTVRAAGKSRATKRKAAPAPVDDDDSDEEFEKMDVDAAMEPAPELSDQQRDTTEDEDETASEEEEDGDSPVEVPPAKQAPPKKSAQSHEKPGPATKEAPPPKRALPFARKKQAPAKPSPPPADSETESDDEL
ncbi:mitotic apparatus protein p62-like protein [Colletotrichum truncatum]|uniref:Mitotic apparatus protein p62-like protein n=1 Tax=Colletotrichum truncatum TaxID=5467 RepID=A0ACC3ZA52_COLTU